MARKSPRRYRSAITGRYVGRRYATRHPKTTVGESTHRRAGRRRK